MTQSSGGTLADFMVFLWRHRRLIVGVVGIVTLAAVIYVLVVPVQYTATATVLPQEPESGGLFSAALSYLGGSLPSLDLGSITGEGRIQEAIVRSRRMADLMNEKFDLDRRYKTKKRESRLRVWDSRLDVDTNRQGLLTVGYRDRDPEFASQMVNSLLEYLDRFNREIRTTSGRRVREFLETRIEEAEAHLDAIEDSLAAFQKSHQLLTVGEDSELGSSLISHRI